MRARSWGAALLVAVVVGTFGAAGTAHAIPSGFGWSASWDYYLPNAFQVNVALPGGNLVAYSEDNGGSRRLTGSVIDVDGRDRYCTRARLIATDTNTVLATKTACDGGYQDFNTAAFWGPVFLHLDLMQGTTIVRSTFTFVPSSNDDPTLRTVGTGTSWSYVNAGQYHLEVHRVGVDVEADGTHQVDNQRSVAGSVVDSGVAGSCAEVRVADATTEEVGTACGIGASGLFDGSDFAGYINITGCYYPPALTKRCVRMYFPEPY